MEGDGGFMAEREELNKLVLAFAGPNVKKFFNLDWRVYQEGALPVRVKELMGLVASLVLRCDDCVTYHLVRCREAGVSGAEVEEALAIGLVVGGSVTIPHLRRAVRAWDEMKGEGGRIPPDKE